MKVYVAARYKWEVGKKTFHRLQEAGINAFLPRDINIDVKSIEDQDKVYNLCMNQIINECDAILFIYPFGYSVSTEMGAAAAMKILGKDIKILLLNLSQEKPCKPQLEDMMNPSIDEVFTDVEEVIEYLNKLCK